MNELELKLIELMEAMGLSVDEYVTQKISEFASIHNTDVATLQDKLSAIDVALDGVGDGEITVGQNIITQISGLEGRLTTVEGNTAALGSQITAETVRAEAAEAVLNNKIDAEQLRAETAEAALDTVINNALIEGEARVAALEEDKLVQETRMAATEAVDAAQSAAITATEGELDVLNGDDTVVGSVAKSVKDAVDVETAARTDADVALQEQITEITGGGVGSIGDLENRVEANETSITDIQANKLDVTKVTSLNIVSIENVFRAKLGLVATAMPIV